ncbi:retinol dehydrogenase 13-like [Stylophora pistillata]|nr:retinol dehydrogenase 13-like [Stylophora pistillata]
MPKTILITGATDGIGLATSKKLVSLGHHLLLHGRNLEKLEHVREELSDLTNTLSIETYVADLSHMEDIEQLAKAISDKHTTLDVLINNAGVYKSPTSTTQEGLDIRFAVNTIAPYLLTKRLLPLLNASGRIINLSSAAQSPVDLKALSGHTQLSDREAYAQSKLAITMWSRHMADSIKGNGPAIIAVNPGSLLGSKMVKEAFGIKGGDINIGAEILIRAALSEEFASASGHYFDNDSGKFAAPYPDALDPKRCEEVVMTIKDILEKMLRRN